ncbi:hypothetical protein H5410_040145 [Solanum commersonii]|uniref:Uncharacterized protein n=1 Tax=Solanum commersonii TaxID=4109 RepID=A0A9J5XQ49_SOLCO|nr:hypothetical protein H5410_040145 [Solanum commersonii]
MLGSLLNSFNWKLEGDIEPKDLVSSHPKLILCELLHSAGFIQCSPKRAEVVSKIIAMAGYLGVTKKIDGPLDI